MAAADIAYSLTFHPAHHYLHVSATAADAPTWMMATWTPGSYMVREFARHIEQLRAVAADGTALAATKVRKNRWQLTLPDGSAPRGTVTVSYRLYCREMSVRTNWLDADFALLNGAATFLSPLGAGARPHAVHVALPPGWRQVVTALPPHPDGADGHFLAADFDALVDGPLLCGSPEVHRWRADGAEYTLASEGGAGVWDGARAAADAQAILAGHVRFWGEQPCRHYVLLNLLTEGRGGLEHASSAVLMASRWASSERGAYLDWLGLVSHEAFHLWNVKRLRPAALGPFDYEQEVPTRSLWVAEGLTAYYDDLLLRRAGLASEREYLTRLGRQLAQLEATPGRLVQSLGDASFDAWIKFYRRDENSDHSGVSYYLKGAVLGLVLDALIRVASADARSLDDVMRLAMARHGGAAGYSEAAFRAVCGEVAGRDLAPLFAAAIDAPGELDLAPALAALGLARTRPAAPATAPRAQLGARARVEGGRLTVTQVDPGGPAWDAGVNVEDELIGFAGLRPAPGQWLERFGQLPPGEPVSLCVARREVLRTLQVRPLPPPPPPYELGVDAAASAAAVARRQRWLSG